MSVAEMSNAEIITKFGSVLGDSSGKNSGLTEVQIALLTKRILVLTQHFKSNNDDKHSKGGMLRIIARRKKMLAYLKRTSFVRYKNLIKELGIRK